MSIWNWLTGGGKRVEQPDMIWLTSTARLEGARKRVVDEVRNCRLVILTSHFAERLEELRSLLDRQSFAYREAERAVAPREIERFLGQDKASILLAPACALLSNEPSATLRDPTRRVAVFVVERHPLRMFDEKLEQFAAAVPYPTELQFFVSYDDAGMQSFPGISGDRVRSVLRHLGMEENEPIESAMVVRRIKAGQRKMEKRYAAAQGMQRDAALERLRGEPLREWRSAGAWLAEHGVEEGY